MKFFSRKGFVAAATSAALVMGTLSVPAQAEEVTTSATTPVTVTATATATRTVTATPTTTTTDQCEGSSFSNLSSSNCRKETTTAIKEWVTLITTIAALFTAVISITNNINNLSKAVVRK